MSRDDIDTGHRISDIGDNARPFIYAHRLILIDSNRNKHNLDADAKKERSRQREQASSAARAGRGN